MASTTFDTAFVEQYKDAVHMNAEINGGKFTGKVREEEIVGESRFIETLGSVTASVAGAAYSDSPTTDITHDRRQCVPTDYEVGLEIDNFNKVKALANFENPYVTRMVSALMRYKDIEVITGALGSVQTGKSGGTTVDFDTDQVVAVTVGGSGSNAGLNVDKLRAARQMFSEAGYDLSDPTNAPYIVVAPGQINNMLGQVEVTSADYNSIKALVNGEVNQFMGFTFIESNLTPYVASDGTAELTWATTGTNKPTDTDSTSLRACFAYVKNAIFCGSNPSMKVRVAERADKRFNWYAYASMGTGAIRMEEAGVIQINCDESV